MIDMRHLALVSAAALLLAAVAVQAEQPPQESRLTFDVLFGDAPGGEIPGERQWSPRGDRLAYVWDEGDGEALWILDVASGESRRVLPLAELSLDSYAWAPAGDALLLSAGGDLHWLELGGAELRRLTETEAEEEDPKLSPDGTRVAFVRDFDLHLIDLATGDERALTTGGEENVLLNGITDWVYWEEIWGRDSTGYWWSPDGTKIAYYQFEEEPVGIYPLVDHLPVYPEIVSQKYPKAGSDNPRVKVGVLDLAGSTTTWLATGDDPTEYLARVDWRPAGDRVMVQRLNRDQTRLDLLSCDSGTGECAALLTETHPTWVNLGDDHRFLPDGRFIWGSERSGWRHLYLYDAEGKLLRQLTDGDRAVTSLDAVDAPEGWAVYTIYGEGPWGPARRVVERVRLADGERQVLAGREGWNSAEVAPATGHLVHRWSDADSPGTIELVKAGGGTLDLPSRPPAYEPEALPQWSFLWIDGPEGVKLPARLLEPRGVPEGARAPVVMYHYGGPASQVVVDRWDGRGRDLWHKMMAQTGFGVLTVDNQASVFFGKAGEDRVHRRFGPINLAAQKAGVAFLGTLPWVDPERIGLWGWSGGGSNTLYSMLNSPGTWRAGVSGAPVTDWRFYDTIWTERYLDRPQDNEEGYRASSPVTHAANLADALLVVHGTADDNVHPQNTIVLSNALIEAGKPFEQAIYPGQDHGFDGASERHFYERMTRFFERELGGSLTPARPSAVIHGEETR